jgi:hypothetical protein
MPRYFLPCFALVWLVGGAGCWKDNPAFYIDSDTTRGSDSTGFLSSTGAHTASSSDTTPTTDGIGSDSGTAGLTSTGGATASSSTTTASGTSGTSTTSGASTEPGTTTDQTVGMTGTESTGSSTGAGECMNGVMGDPPRLEVKKDGQVLDICSGAKGLTGAFASFSGSTLQIHDSGDCTETGTLYEVTGVNFSIMPMDLGDSCFDVQIEWAPAPPCEVTGFGLSNGDNPLYVGAFGRRTGPSGYGAFSAESTFDCGCAVDDVTCCEHVFELDQATYSPGGYTLGFPDARSDIGAGEAVIGTIDGNDYLFTNLRSHVHESCDAAPSHVWLDIRWWAMEAN